MRPKETGEKSAGQDRKKKKGGLITTLILCLFFLAGLGLLLYPTLSDYYNSLHQSSAIAHYAESVAALSEEDMQALWDAAAAYNEELPGKNYGLSLPQEAVSEYEALLDIDGNGMMGYIEIAKISVYLPIYHGTDEDVLRRNIGHIEGSSLPVGGTSSHCVLSGHRGLTSAKLFTELDRLVVGDTFILHILDRDLYYEVDQILTVLPDEVSALAITKDEDYCTLVTCTPYGINTHRLLVRGHRIDPEAEAVRVTGDALKLDSAVIAPVVAVPILILLLIVLLWSTRKKKEYIPTADDVAGIAARERDKKERKRERKRKQAEKRKKGDKAEK